jgi:hypothetical protein
MKQREEEEMPQTHKTCKKFGFSDGKTRPCLLAVDHAGSHVFELANDDEYLPITITLSPQAHRWIDKLLATGLFGLTREEVVERFVCERLREYIK